MLTILTFSILLFLLVTAFYLNISRKRSYRNPLHNPMRIIFCLIYSINLAGYIIAGYLVLSYEIEVIVDYWQPKFFIVTLILLFSSPVIYFSREIGNTIKMSITKLRIGLTIINIYPLFVTYSFYNQ